MQYEMQNQKITDYLEASMDGIREFTNVQNAIGQPITPPSGVTVIPIFRISVGFASGGFDLPAKKIAQDKNRFSGGGGSGVSVAPVAFLSVAGDGSVRLIPITDGKGASADRVADLIERSPDIVGRLKKTFFGPAG